MTTPRFSIAGLLFAVAIAAVSIAIWQAGARLAVGLLFFATLTLLLVAVLAAVYCRGDARAFSLGAALFGWSYAIVVLIPWNDNLRETLDAPGMAFRSAFFTTSVPDGGDQSVLRYLDTQHDRAGRRILGWPAWQTFGPAFHSIATILFGLVGGFVARILFRRNRPTAPA